MKPVTLERNQLGQITLIELTGKRSSWYQGNFVSKLDVADTKSHSGVT